MPLETLVPKSTPERGQEVGAAQHPLARLLEIDRIKGIAIILVVWGHTPTLLDPPLWYRISIAIVYSFHMPLFMYLSGFVFFLVAAQTRFWQSPARHIAIRADRLLVPFIAFAAVVVIGKYAVSSFLAVSDPVASVHEGFKKVVLNTADNPSASIWYLLVLFVFTVMAPVLWRLGRKSLVLIIAVGLLGWLFSFPRYFYFDRMAQYFIFFGIGGVAALHWRYFRPFLERSYVPLVIAFIICVWSFYDHPYALLLCGLLSLPAFHGFFLQNFWSKDKTLLWIGRCSMSIYLFNTVALGVAKIFALPLLSIASWTFLPVMLILVLVGLFVPIGVRAFVRSSSLFRSLRRYID